MSRVQRPLTAEARARVEHDPDYVAVGHHGNSLKALKDAYPDEAPNHIIARALGYTEKQVHALWASTVGQLRRLLRVVKGG